MLRNQKGFTLMELMIVIVIIGVLAAIAVPQYTGYVNRAKKASCQANQRNLETAAGLYYVDQSTPTHTTDIADLVPYLDNAALIACPSGGEYSLAGGNVTCTITDHN